MATSPDAGLAVEAVVPRVTLRSWFAHPFDAAIAAARTCYAPRLIRPEEITDRQRRTVSAATFFSGHHTVYQHAYFEFGLEDVSRQFVWSFLHAHPFYNSEQQSQRFVRLDRPRVYVQAPEGRCRFGPAERALYEAAVLQAWEAYRRLAELLRPLAREILADIWHADALAHPRRIEKVERLAEKRALEVARYVLPVCAATTLVHTVSGIVLHRLWRMVGACDTPTEARQVVGEMVARVREVDPEFFDRFGTQPREQFPEWAWGQVGSAAEAFAGEFDRWLGGRRSRLVQAPEGLVGTLGQAFRTVLGLPAAACSDAEAIERLLDPRRNPYRLEVLNVGVHAPAMRALDQVHLTFAKRLSHTADSQNQRHRMVPGARPLLTLADTRQPDYIVPALVAQSPQAHELFVRTMERLWAAKNELLDRGVAPEVALYLLPNAKVIRLVESASLLHLLHKWTMRTCFNAQEEIYEASMEELEQVRERFPEIARYVGPPCYLRAGVATPICTEGSHFCGVRVWESFPQVRRRL
jgi:thymidylate synthase ThyX